MSTQICGGSLSNFVTDIQLPHVLPVQGPFVIKLLGALAKIVKKQEEDHAKNGGTGPVWNPFRTPSDQLAKGLMPWSSAELEEAANQLATPYSAARESKLPRMTEHTIRSLANDLAKLCDDERPTTAGAMSTLVEKLVAKIQECLNQASSFGAEQPAPETTEPASGYAEIISKYLSRIFNPSFSTDCANVPDQKPPYPIEHDLVLYDRGGENKDFFDDPEARKAYEEVKTKFDSVQAAYVEAQKIKSGLHDKCRQQKWTDFVTKQRFYEAKERLERVVEKRNSFWLKLRSVDAVYLPKALAATSLAYYRAVAVGSAIRQVLVARIATNGEVSRLSETALANATSTAVSLLCCAALRFKKDPASTGGCSWDKIEGLDFSDEYAYLTEQWGNSIDSDRRGEQKILAELVVCHGAGAEVFLAPALHMLGCSQVAAVGNRAWPAVFYPPSPSECFKMGEKKVDTLLDDSLPSDTRRDNICCWHASARAFMFGRIVMFNESQVTNRRASMQGVIYDTKESRKDNYRVNCTYIDGTAARPDVVKPPTAAQPTCEINRLAIDHPFYTDEIFADIMSVELKTGVTPNDEANGQLMGHRGISILLAVEQSFLRGVKTNETQKTIPAIAKSLEIYWCSMCKCPEVEDNFSGASQSVKREYRVDFVKRKIYELYPRTQDSGSESDHSTDPRGSENGADIGPIVNAIRAMPQITETAATPVN